MGDGTTISVRALRVHYGARVALAGIDLTVGPGITALLGPNGAGKTTLMSTLTGMRPDDGAVWLAGHDLGGRRGRQRARGLVGYLPQRFDLAGGLTVRDTVRYASWCNGTAREQADEATRQALDVTELTVKCQDRVRTLSGGERQRLGLACAIAHRPKVLLLDEPTVGLDPDQRVRFRRYLTSIAADCSVLLATHLLSDVAILAHRLIVLSNGHVVFEGTPGELAGSADARDSAETPLECGYRRVLKAEADKT